MARPFKTKIIGEKPKVDEFKPRGIPSKLIDKIYITLDEYEAIRLADYLGMEHVDAAELMGISRPTFTRLVERARHKVSKALVEAKSMVLEGGDVIIRKRSRCSSCGIEYLDRPGYRHRCGKYMKIKGDL
ncbi:MAG: DUF134 domain-containing protein [Deferribacterota bacterium]|nr:DUF134 domain-containing protein [Deferribacterota bacterium]